MQSELVRDKVPDILKEEGEKPYCESMSPDEFSKALDKQLEKEVKEYLESKDLEEMADILEVLSAILNIKGLTLFDLEKIRINKYIKTGGFEKGIKMYV